MEASQTFESPQYAAQSPNGLYIASLTQQNLYIQHASSLAPAFTYPLDHPAPSKVPYESHTISWSALSTHVLLVSGQGVHVFSLNDPSLNIHVTNGTGSLGRIHAAEVIAKDGREQLLVVCEFGRVNLWDLSSGRATEVGDLKMTCKGNAWAVRRVVRQAEVLVLLMRQNAQDVLSFYLPPSVAPFRSISLPTTDALSLSWSPCGRWLAVLDCALSQHQVHVYTAEGFPFRQYPRKGQLTPPTTPSREQVGFGCGFKSLAWSSDHLLMTETQSIGLLDKRTFSDRGTIALANIHTENTTFEEGVVAFQETIDAARQRSYSMLTGQSITVPTPTSSIIDVRSNAIGSLATCRDEAWPTVLYIIHIGTQRVRSILVQHTAIRRAVWHPARPSLLIVLGDDGSLHLWDSDSGQPPLYIAHDFVSKSEAGRVEVRWISPTSEAPNPPEQDLAKLAILLTTRKGGYQVLWPEGRPEPGMEVRMSEHDTAVDEGDQSQDSLYDILSGRTPLPELKVQRIEAEAEAEPTVRLEDTFRGRLDGKVGASIEDDSEIF